MFEFVLWLSIALTAFVLAVLIRDDWHHFSHPRRQVQASVVRHHRWIDDGLETFAPVLQFKDETGAIIDVVDVVYRHESAAPIGSTRLIDYPVGYPHKARVRRPILRAIAYLALMSLLAVLVMRLMNWIS